MKFAMKSTVVVSVAWMVSGCACHVREGVNEEPHAMLKIGTEDLNPESVAMSNVYFAFDKYALTDESKYNLKKNATWLLRNSDVEVRIEGNADERGTNRYNMELGQRRASAAADYLKVLGISPGRIMTISFGEENPATPNRGEVGWAKDRRVEFKALGLEDSQSDVEE